MSENEHPTNQATLGLNEHPTINKPGYWYLAGPYSDNPPERYLQHLEAAAIFTKNGFVIYSPIVHCHDMSVKYDMPGDADFWEHYNYTMLRRSNGMIIVKLPGWVKSNGVKKELNFCFDHDIQAWSVEPLTVGSEFISWKREI